MALPFLPWTHIADVFRAMAVRCPPQLQDLVNYIQQQWIQNPIFPIRSWSVYNFTVRTNNNVEGWHYWLNGKANGLPLPFYRFVPLLMWEADVVKTRIAASDLERDVRRSSTRIQIGLQEASNRYMEEEITASHFLKICGSNYVAPFDQ